PGDDLDSRRRPRLSARYLSTDRILLSRSLTQALDDQTARTAQRPTCALCLFRNTLRLARRRRMTSRALLLCGVALFAGGSLGVAGAQGINAAAQAHLDRAKAAAFRPGHSLMMLYENVCADALSPEGPVEPRPTDGG